MNDQGDRNFHILMGVLLFVSLVVDQQDYAAWRAGRVSMVTLVLAMVWLGRFAMEGFRGRDARIKVLQNRVSAVEERVDDIERETKPPGSGI